MSNVCDLTGPKAPADPASGGDYRNFRPLAVKDLLVKWQKGDPICKETLLVRSADAEGNWVGEAEHECLPDFSCCYPDLLATQEMRNRFVAAYASDNHAETELLLSAFLEAMLMSGAPKVPYIAGAPIGPIH